MIMHVASPAVPGRSASIPVGVLVLPLMVLVASCGGGHVPPQASAAPTSAATGPTVPRATEGSAVPAPSRNVIVTLAVPFTPEGELPSREAVSRQRRAVSEAQDGLLADLAPFAARLLVRFDGPQLALLVDDDAVAYLRSSPRVAVVQDDVPKPPSG